MPLDLLPIARGMVLLCDFVNTVNSVNKVQKISDTPLLDRAHLINRLVILGCVLTQVGMEIGGAPAKDLQIEKTLEIFPRMAEVCFRCMKETSRLGNEMRGAEGDSKLSKRILRVLEKGIIAPGADLVRVFAEVGYYQEQAYLELSPEEFARTKRIVPIDEDHWKEVPLVREECLANKAAYEKVAVVTSFIRASSEAGVINTTVHTTGNIYVQLALFFRSLRGLGNVVPQPVAAPLNRPAQPVNQPLNRPVQVVNRTAQEDIEEVREVIDFRRLPFIPTPLHQDPVFSKYVCPITGCPIRDPVGDPNRHTLYEREAITAWLEARLAQNLPLTSPVTQLPLLPEDLIEKPALRQLIDHRLGFFQNSLLQHMETPEFQANFATAVAAELQASVDLENPNL